MTNDFKASKGWLEKFKKKYHLQTFTPRDLKLIREKQVANK